jgi:hypothetical protein
MADWVLTNEAVRRAIQQLRAQSVHPYFPAYLHLRRQAARQGTAQDIEPDWQELSPFLQLRGAPTSKPHFRPFTSGTGASGAEWLNPNLAGSFAPSSLRQGQPPLKVVEISTTRGGFNLKPKHWELARTHLLSEVKLPLWAVAAFVLRDFALEDYPSEPGYDDLEVAFAEVFGYEGPGSEDFEHLYDRTPAHDIEHWYEQFQTGAEA